MMKKHTYLTMVITAALSFVMSAPPCPAQVQMPEALQQPDWSGLTRKNHPRLFITDADLKGMVKQISRGTNPQLTTIHNSIMATADSKGLSDKPLSYDPEAKAATLLPTIREGMTRIISDAWAYRYTRDPKYLLHAEDDINVICDNMAKWNTVYFLVRAEMAMTFAVAYDWLYKSLSRSTRAKMLACLDTEVYEVAKTRGSYKATNNWNHVTNAGLVCSALATFEAWPEKARALVMKSVESNPIGLKGTYYPDGASPEGPTYWAYAMSWEGMMLMSLKDMLGTDFGLSKAQGFEQSAYYRIFAENNGRLYNYGDAGEKAGASVGSWFCALWFDNPAFLIAEMPRTSGRNYLKGSRDAFLALACSYRLGEVKPGGIEKRTYRAGGRVPIAILRNGWDKKASFLGIKGGSPNAPHGHMDIGSFVFDACGVRWACEYPTKSYEIYRRMIKKAGSRIDLFNMSQASFRWHLFPYNNRQHSTLTVNGRQQEVSGSAVMIAPEDPGSLVATVDMSSIYKETLTRAVRTASIEDDGSLRLIDDVAASGQADVRWTMVTATSPTVGEDGIILEKNGVRMLLRASGADVTYREWPNDPSKYDTPVKDLDYPSKGYHMVGFEFSLAPGASAVIETRLVKQ